MRAYPYSHSETRTQPTLTQLLPSIKKIIMANSNNNTEKLKKRRRWDDGAPAPIEIASSSSDSDSDACMIVPTTAPNPYSKNSSKNAKKSSSQALCLSSEENEKIIKFDYKMWTF